MPITIFGVTTSHHRDDGSSKKLEDYVTKDQVHDKKYINKNFIKKDIIGNSSSYVTLHSQRRIATIKPGIDANDAITKKQTEDLVSDLGRQVIGVIKGELDKLKDDCANITDELSRAKRSLGNSFLPFLDNDDVNFEDKRLRNVGDPIAPKDAVNLKYISTKIYLTGKLKNGHNPTFVLTGGTDYFLCLYKGTVFGFYSFPAPDHIIIKSNGKEVKAFDSFNFNPFDKITFHPKFGVIFTEGYKFL
jgi:hypothetical protein